MRHASDSRAGEDERHDLQDKRRDGSRKLLINHPVPNRQQLKKMLKDLVST